MSILSTAIEYLKGVGPAKADLLKKELQIFRYADLLQLYPYRYVDRSRFYKIKELGGTAAEVQIKGRITNMEVQGPKGRGGRLKATFQDDTGEVELVWFKGVQWIQKSLKLHQDYVLYGKPNFFNGGLSFPHPELDLEADFKRSPLRGLQPLYPSTDKLNQKGLNNRGLAKLTKVLLPQLKGALPDFFPAHFRERYALMPREEALMQIHFPSSIDKAEAARTRLKFEELFFFQMEMAAQKRQHHRDFQSFAFAEVGAHFNHFYEKVLPFELTGAQKRVLKEIRQDMRYGKHMNRLLQGDVGSGKTMVALMAMLIAIDNGFQACLMAPTEILAQQHYQGIRELLEDSPLEVALLTGSVKTADRKVIHEKLQSGELHILIGTHALLEDKVKYKNLGLAVVDEQHRFGVAQRAKLWKKNKLPPHILVMTATPIPRTLAMSIYGNLDLSVIDELPPGRKPITTSHAFDKDRNKLFGFLESEIEKGRQVYIVYPLIEESEKMDYKDLMDGYESICRAFPRPKYQVSVVHGKMKPEDKDFEMQRFASGKTQIMVATTVIEVGVNVPNASVMVIESAERFGLSQLHQLRGRVGRGAEKSYCILMTGPKLSRDAQVRMKTMVRTQDGFEIADVDLKLRGPGDLTGTQQSGMLNLKLADLRQDTPIMDLSRRALQDLFNADPSLKAAEHQSILEEFAKRKSGKIDWGRIA
ncbi:ATP-dependent DNA helicase RecG [Croceimicrobium sp.]|uniref:ATP-dependent DNA helicase RecG n=1 Tax=Croceimicrobium sp. TaxID=2828340 RepID=UPI003BAB2C8B